MKNAAIDWTPKARAVLRAAEELFYAHGIHAVGGDAIAERAGVTKKTLYDRFGSKERLVVEYLRRRDDEWRQLLDAHLKRADGDPRAQLAAIFEASAEWSGERGAKGCAMINAFAEINDPAHPAYAVIVGQKQWMLDLFTRITTDAFGVNSPRRRDVAEALLLLHDGTLVAAGMGIVENPMTRAGEQAAQLLGAPTAGSTARGEAFPIINCTDLGRAREWYERVLSGRLTYQFPEEGDAQYLTLRVGAGQIALGNGYAPALYGETPRPATGHAVDLCVYVPDLDAVVDAAVDAVVTPPADMPWGERIAYLQDPEGTMLLVIQDEG